MQTTYQITGSFTGADQIVARYKEIEAGVKSVTNALKEQVSASGRLGSEASRSSSQRTRQLREEEAGILKVAHQYEKYYRGIQQVKGIWQEQFEGFRKYDEAGQTLQRAELQFKTLNLGTSETAKGLKAVDDVVQRGRNTYADMTAELQNLHSAFGDLEHATEFLGMASDTEYVFGTLFGKSPQETQRDIQQTMRALEQMNALRMTGPPDASGHASLTEADKKRFEEYYDTVFKMKMMTRDAVNGNEIQQFVARGGVAAKQLSPEGLRNMTYLIQEMHGGAAGNALASMFQSFVALRQGGGSQRSAEAMMALGLIDMEKARRENLIEFTKGGGHIKKLKPGAVPIADLLSQDPMQFAGAILESLKKHGKDAFGKNFELYDKTGNIDMKAVAVALSQITGSRTAMNELASMITQSAQIYKDSRNVNRAMGRQEAVKMLDENGVGQVKRWEVAIENFEQKAGQPLLHTLAGLGTVGTPFLNFLEKHPTMTMAGMSAFKLTTGLMGTLAAFRNFQAANAIINGSAIWQTGSQAATAAAQVGFYRRQLTGIPAVLGTTITLGLATGVIAYLVKLKDEAEAAWNEAHQAAASGDKTMSKMLGEKNVPDDVVRSVMRNEATSSLSNFFKNLENEGPWYTSVIPFWKNQAWDTDKSKLMDLIGKQMPGLSRPSSFAEFMAAIDSSKQYDKNKDAVRAAARDRFPSAAAAYDKAIEASGGDKFKAIEELMQKDREAAKAAEAVQVQLNKLAGAAGDLSGKFENFHFPGRTDDDGKPNNGPGFFHKNSFHQNFGLGGSGLTRVLGRFNDTASRGHAIAVNGGGTHLEIHELRVPVTVHGDGNAVEIEAAVKRGIKSSKDELLKVINIAYKDRRPVA